MHYSAQLLSLATLTALLFPTLEVAAVTPQRLHNPSFAQETGTLLVQNDPPSNVLLEVEGILEAGDDSFDDVRLVDSYQFEGQAGQTITILLSGEEFAPFFALMSSNGQFTASSDDINPLSLNTGLTVTLPADDTYLVAVTSTEVNVRGSYQLTIIEATPNELKQVEANRLFQQGVLQYRISQFQEALQSWEQALDGRCSVAG